MSSRPAGTAAAAWAIAVACWATAAPAQTLGQAPADSVPIWRVVAALLVCIALALGAAYALRSRLRGRLPGLISGPRRLEVVETLRLSHQIDLCLIRCDGADLVVAATAQGLVVVRAPAGGPAVVRP